jgi:hypothetical protein
MHLLVQVDLGSSGLLEPISDISPCCNHIAKMIVDHDTLRPITVLILDSFVMGLVVIYLEVSLLDSAFGEIHSLVIHVCFPERKGRATHTLPEQSPDFGKSFVFVSSVSLVPSEGSNVFKTLFLH